MKLSRRDALRAGGGLLATAGLAGCVEERVTRVETRVEESSIWALSPEQAGSARTLEAFENYTERMEERYGDSGVWGLDAERPDSFETAFVQRFALSRESPGGPIESEVSLDPDDVEPEAPLLIGDACVVMYDLGDGRHRYWLWMAADATDERLVRNLSVSSLGAGVRLRGGSIADAAQPTVAGGEATVGIGTEGPAGTFPLRGGTLDTTIVRDEAGVYEVDWSGELDDMQSINGVCEEQRSGAYEFSWVTSLGYRFDETV